ncbi:4Fe-4S binding protein [Hippea jasoniae]|uniref:4Fe-4S binding protein n=1 Tax=Hippea jasoniae TaxID=944479 RepID=UPI00054D398A|nr:4Fe-4S binding protein [Hippea jasoniae]
MAEKRLPVEINEKLCKGCGLCVHVCPKNVLEMVEDLHVWMGTIAKVVRPEDCIRCKMCEDICPDFSIKVADVGVELTFEDSKGNLITKSK